jgi:hypothetical protein
VYGDVLGLQFIYRGQDPEVISSNPVITGLDNYGQLIGPPVIAILSTLMLGFTLFLFSQENEFKD